MSVKQFYFFILSTLFGLNAHGMQDKVATAAPNSETIVSGRTADMAALQKKFEEAQRHEALQKRLLYLYAELKEELEQNDPTKMEVDTMLQAITEATKELTYIPSLELRTAHDDILARTKLFDQRKDEERILLMQRGTLFLNQIERELQQPNPNTSYLNDDLETCVAIYNHLREYDEDDAQALAHQTHLCVNKIKALKK